MNDKEQKAKIIMNKIHIVRLLERGDINIALSTFPEEKEYIENFDFKNLSQVKSNLEDELMATG